jgi:hypothetical protein
VGHPRLQLLRNRPGKGFETSPCIGVPCLSLSPLHGLERVGLQRRFVAMGGRGTDALAVMLATVTAGVASAAV